MTLFILAFLAGALTAAAPCILPLLPVIIGGTIASSETSKKLLLRRALIIIGSLAVSLFIFTLILKATTALLGVPQIVWQVISGGIVLLLGINFLLPQLWQSVSLKLGLSLGANKRLGAVSGKKGTLGAIATGAALGPVFSSCSPTYALILAAILPASFGLGILYLLAYIAGLSAVLFLVAYFGGRLTHKLGWALDEHGIFRRIIGAVFIVVGLAVLFGWDKSLQTFLLEQGVYDGSSGLEDSFTSLR